MPFTPCTLSTTVGSLQPERSAFILQKTAYGNTREGNHQAHEERWGTVAGAPSSQLSYMTCRWMSEVEQNKDKAKDISGPRVTTQICLPSSRRAPWPHSVCLLTTWLTHSTAHVLLAKRTHKPIDSYQYVLLYHHNPALSAQAAFSWELTLLDAVMGRKRV